MKKSIGALATLLALSLSGTVAMETVAPKSPTVATAAEAIVEAMAADGAKPETNGETKPYETLDFFIFQSFFDNMSENFIPPLLGNLTVFTLPTITGNDKKLVGEMDVDYEFSEMKISNASISPAVPIVKINNGWCTVAVKDLTLNLTADYSYITDPPVFADIGDGNLLFDKVSASFDIATMFT